MTKSRYFWHVAFALKIFLVLNSRSIYVSDEINQSVAVSYDMVYGGRNLSWEWNKEYKLRPVLYPLIFATIFKILNILSLDFRFLILYSPNIIHAIFWQISDLYVLKLLKIESKEMNQRERENNQINYSNHQNNYAGLAVLIYMGVWTILIINARASTNAVETILLPIGVYYWTQIKTISEDKDLVGKFHKINSYSQFKLTFLVKIFKI